MPENEKKQTRKPDFFARISRNVKLAVLNEPEAPDTFFRGLATFIQDRTMAGDSPQALQGLWQAYGQIRAAKISGRFTLLATGIAGVGLWGYQQFLSRQKNEIDYKESGIRKREALLVEHEKEQERAVRSIAILEKKFDIANAKVLQAYQGKSDGYFKEYQRQLEEAERDGRLVSKKVELADEAKRMTPTL